MREQKPAIVLGDFSRSSNKKQNALCAQSKQATKVAKRLCRGKRKTSERSPHPFLEAVSWECENWSRHLCRSAPEVAVLLAFDEADVGFLNVNQTWPEVAGNAHASRRSWKTLTRIGVSKSIVCLHDVLHVCPACSCCTFLFSSLHWAFEKNKKLEAHLYRSSCIHTFVNVDVEMVRR